MMFESFAKMKVQRSGAAFCRPFAVLGLLVVVAVAGRMDIVGTAQAQQVAADHSYVVTRGTTQASKPAPQGANDNLDHHGFRFFCVPSHYSYNDPVVYPGQQGKAHLHMFFGNTAVDANTTSESIMSTGGTTCDGGTTNRSAYWIPALYNAANEVVLPKYINNYYKSWVDDRSKIRPIPAGLQILANDRVPGSAGVVVSKVDQELWPATIRVSPHDGLTVEIIFPDCIAVDRNGDPILTSPGGTSHVAYSSGSCPRSHPYTIPRLTQLINWDNVPFDSDWRLSSDAMAGAPKGTTIHADYIAGWTPEAALTMANCVRDGFKECGPPLHLHWQDQFFSPEGSRVYDFFKIADSADSTPVGLAGWPPMLMAH